MTEKKDAVDVLEEAEQEQEKASEYVRDGADFFHSHEGEMFERTDAHERLKEEFDIDDRTAQEVIAELVGDTVDPIVQAESGGSHYVGVVDYVEGDGWYGYVDYDDIQGKRKRVVCAQCVHEAEFDSEVTHATAGDPSGSFADQPDAGYDELAEKVHEHYEAAHDGVVSEDVETGARLTSGTKMGGNRAFHKGYMGSGSGLDADTLDGQSSSYYDGWEYGYQNTRSISKSIGITIPSASGTNWKTTKIWTPQYTDERRRRFKLICDPNSEAVYGEAWFKKNGNTLLHTSTSGLKASSAVGWRTNSVTTGDNFTLQVYGRSETSMYGSVNATAKQILWRG